jgi:hypothetical protein
LGEVIVHNFDLPGTGVGRPFYFLFSGDNCCANKTVGDVKYYLDSKDLFRTRYYGCKDECIYRR